MSYHNNNYNNRRERINEDDVPESKHTIFIRGLPGSMSTDEVKDFFEDKIGPVSFDFVRMTPDNQRLFVAVRFETREDAKSAMNKYCDRDLMGHRCELSWFKDIRRYAQYQQTIQGRGGGGRGRPFFRGRGNYRNNDRYDNRRGRSRSRRSSSGSSKDSRRSRSKGSRSRSRSKRSSSRDRSSSSEDRYRKRKDKKRRRRHSDSDDDFIPPKNGARDPTASPISNKEDSLSPPPIARSVQNSPTPTTFKINIKSKEEMNPVADEVTKTVFNIDNDGQVKVIRRTISSDGNQEDVVVKKEKEADSTGDLPPPPAPPGDLKPSVAASPVMVGSFRPISSASNENVAGAPERKKPRKGTLGDLLPKHLPPPQVVLTPEDMKREPPPRSTVPQHNTSAQQAFLAQTQAELLKKKQELEEQLQDDAMRTTPSPEPTPAPPVPAAVPATPPVPEASPAPPTAFVPVFQPAAPVPPPSTVSNGRASCSSSSKSVTESNKPVDLARPSSFSKYPATSKFFSSLHDLQNEIIQTVRAQKPEEDDDDEGGMRLSSLATESDDDDALKLAAREEKLASLDDSQVERFLLQKKKLETKFRNDCETFAIVTKKLLAKDATLEQPLRIALMENFEDLEKQFMEKVDKFLFI